MELCRYIVTIISLKNIKSYFDHTPGWDEYNLEISAYQKERKGDFKGAIEDLSFAIKDKNLDYYLLFERGKLLFKIKKYKEGKNDLAEFLNAKLKHNSYRYNFEALFYIGCCDIILRVIDIDGLINLNYELSKFHCEGEKYNNFLIALLHSVDKDFEKSLDYLLKIRNLDTDFLKNKYPYLLEHLPQEMKTILELCWHII